MGLAEARKRRRIALDPNNTSWSRNRNNYGQRILSKQGWSPGHTLGARNAAHSSHYTYGSTCYIRVAIKDDNFGLGTNVAKDDEVRNVQRMGAYQDILSRLNAKPEENTTKENQPRKDLERKLYVEQRLGGMRFVSGGFLVGDRVEDVVPLEMREKKAMSQHADGGEGNRYLRDTAQHNAKDKGKLQSDIRKKHRAGSKKREGLRMSHSDSMSDDLGASISRSAIRNGSRDAREGTFQKKHKRKANELAESLDPSQFDPHQSLGSVPLQNSNCNNKDKAKLRKENAKSRDPKSVVSNGAQATETLKRLEGRSSSVQDVQSSQYSSASRFTSKKGMDAVRKKSICHKKMAGMDSQALREVRIYDRV